MGTSAAAAHSVAKSAKAHSGRFSEKIATRSPLPIPRARRPIEVSSTAARNASELMAFHPSAVRCLRCSALRYSSTDR